MARARNPDKINQDKVTMYIFRSLLRDLRLAHAEYCMGDDEQKMTYTMFVNAIIERGLSDFLVSKRGKNGHDLS